jgi:Beta-propeller repeat
MSANASVPKAAGSKVLTRTRPTARVFPITVRRFVVTALALLALVAFAALIAASQVPSAEHYSVGSNDSQSGRAAAPLPESKAAPQMSDEEALDAYKTLPLSFASNKGQVEEAVRYYAQGAGYGFFFTKEGARLSFAESKERGGHTLALDFLGANPHPTLTAQERLSGEVNYLQGNDPTKWQQGLPTHAELHYGGLWPGIDMAVRGEGGKLKYEFCLKPGSSVEDVRLGYRGATGLSVGAGGELLVRTSLGILKDAAPVSYQRIGRERVPVKSRYVLKRDGGYGFAVEGYDSRYPLIIDPSLDYSTFLGGTGGDQGLGIAVDGEGKAYVTGETSSADFPTTPGAFDTSFNGSADAIVTKLNASGSALIYSTFLGGREAFDRGLGIAVDPEGRAYVTGQTFSADFPTTPGTFDTSFNGSADGSADAFVTKLNASGSALIYSTFLGGGTSVFERGDSGLGIAVREGRAYVTGETDSSDFPTTPGAFDTTFNGDVAVFVSKLNASGSALAYSTFLGDVGSGEDIAVDGKGRVYVTGSTFSSNYPTTRGAFDRTLDGSDAFVTKLNASGSALVYSTYLGGTNSEAGRGIAVREGRAYVTGVTDAADFPTTPGAFDTTFNGDTDAFVTKLNASGSALAYSTFLGGTGFDSGLDTEVREGKAYVTGNASSVEYPTTSDAFDRSFNGAGDAFVTKLPTS